MNHHSSAHTDSLSGSRRLSVALLCALSIFSLFLPWFNVFGDHISPFMVITSPHSYNPDTVSFTAFLCIFMLLYGFHLVQVLRHRPVRIGVAAGFCTALISIFVIFSMSCVSPELKALSTEPYRASYGCILALICGILICILTPGKKGGFTDRILKLLSLTDDKNDSSSES